MAYDPQHLKSDAAIQTSNILLSGTQCSAIGAQSHRLESSQKITKPFKLRNLVVAIGHASTLMMSIDFTTTFTFFYLLVVLIPSKPMRSSCWTIYNPRATAGA